MVKTLYLIGLMTIQHFFSQNVNHWFDRSSLLQIKDFYETKTQS